MKGISPKYKIKFALSLPFHLKGQVNGFYFPKSWQKLKKYHYFKLKYTSKTSKQPTVAAFETVICFPRLQNSPGIPPHCDQKRGLAPPFELNLTFHPTGIILQFSLPLRQMNSAAESQYFESFHQNKDWTESTTITTIAKPPCLFKRGCIEDQVMNRSCEFAVFLTF